MIPVKLALRNFMCYRDDVPELRFDNFSIACLSGDNGHGKSAIIDAITWAVWGKSRADGIDELIHAGQAEMSVEYDFQVGDALYRIIRRRSRPRKKSGAGQSVLELYTAGNGSFKAISGATMGETQQKIVDLLHMNYDTFINSAYLRQGHADEFTTKDPANRKEVLASILGFGVYDVLEDRAKEQSRLLESERLALENSLREINEALGQKGQLEADLKQAEQDFAAVESQKTEIEATVNELRRRNEGLQNLKSQLLEIERQTVRETQDLAHWRQQVEQHTARIAGYDKLLCRDREISGQYDNYTAARLRRDEYDANLSRLRALEKGKLGLERVIAQTSQDINNRHRDLKSKIGELEQLSGSVIELEKLNSDINLRRLQVAEMEKDSLASKRQLDAALSDATRFQAENRQLEADIREIREKLDLLSHEDGAHCPLCETKLTADTLEYLKEKLEADLAAKSAALETGRDSLAGKEAETEKLGQEVREIEARTMKERDRLQTEQGAVQQKFGEAETAAVQCRELNAELVTVEERLARRDYAHAEHEALAGLENELAAITYDEAAHEQARRDVASLETYVDLMRSLKEAEERLPAERDALANASAAISRITESLEQQVAKKEATEREISAATGLEETLATAEASFQKVSVHHSQSQEALFRTRAGLANLEEISRKRRTRESELREAARQAELYRELAQAFGKTGIQAMLIEAALPEIEEEANRLLSRMTDNRMQVRFDTQEEKKTGGVRETLAIAISDELGTRSYDMFSGGEAFRINFAVRIALSRILARRAGAPLPTIIIDEGFGTQDSAGIEKLREAINSIQDDFEKIIVVTHIAELRDAFPTRIEVSKTATGATFTVN
ncbi:AAA family ATPase [Chloroflexota bacterium]